MGAPLVVVGGVPGEVLLTYLLALPFADGRQRAFRADRPAEDVAAVRVDRVEEPVVSRDVLVAQPGRSFECRFGGGILQREAPVGAERTAGDGAVDKVRHERIAAVVRDDGPADLAAAVADRARYRRERAALRCVRGRGGLPLCAP
jgi:hypothetical protein